MNGRTGAGAGALAASAADATKNIHGSERRRVIIGSLSPCTIPHWPRPDDRDVRIPANSRGGLPDHEIRPAFDPCFRRRAGPDAPSPAQDKAKKPAAKTAAAGREGDDGDDEEGVHARRDAQEARRHGRARSTPTSAFGWIRRSRPRTRRATSVNTWALGRPLRGVEVRGHLHGRTRSAASATRATTTCRRSTSAAGWTPPATGMMWSTCTLDATGKSMTCKSTSIWDPMSGKPSPMEMKKTFTDHDHYSMEMWGAPERPEVQDDGDQLHAEELAGDRRHLHAAAASRKTCPDATPRPGSAACV